MIRRSHRVLAAVATLAGATGVLAGCGSHHHDAAPLPTTTAPTSTTQPAPPPTTVAAASTGWSLVATTKGTVPRYAAPGTTADGTIPGSWFGGVSALPVIDQQPGWVKVRLVTRPNESVAWVRRGDVDLSETPYRIVINLTSRHLELFRLNQAVLDAPAGVGTPADPTPTGQYFVAMFERSPNAGYGPFVLVTSAHSNTITDWEQSGDAVVAIHGPLGADAAIGTTGAAVSHGCVRLHVSDQVQLRQVPAGTPITITT